MRSIPDLFNWWTTNTYFDESTRLELTDLTGDQLEITDRFYKGLAFGTGGLRGEIGAGTNRVNRYTIRQITQGLALYMLQTGSDQAQRGVVIAHDSRRFSAEFALETALTLNANGIPAYLWESLRPTPLLSYAVRFLKSMAGVVITASHNPKQYNGYKVYWEDGGQIPPERAKAIELAILGSDDFALIHPMDEQKARAAGLLRLVPSAVDQAYQDQLLALLSLPPEQRAACRILYTPLHGSGAIPVRQVLTKAGFKVELVKEQEEPDSEFSTIAYPNPEELQVFELALTIANAKAAADRPDVIMATDPDADRLGVLALTRAGDYQVLTGNQIGAILVEYLLASKSAFSALPLNGVIIKTIATSNLIGPLCKQYGVKLVETHTGFKFIGDLIRMYEETGEQHFLFGFEESYGYLGATFVRDKDAVMGALLVAEAAAFYKARGQTLYDALERIWQAYGYYCEGLHNLYLPGQEGQAQIAAIMTRLRTKQPAQFGPASVLYADDYLTGAGLNFETGCAYPLALAKANVLHYRFADGGFVMLRPSGTEPKLKLYVSAVGDSRVAADAKMNEIMAAALKVMGLE